MSKGSGSPALGGKSKELGFSRGLRSGHPCRFQGQETVIGTRARHLVLIPLLRLPWGMQCWGCGAVAVVDRATSPSLPPSFVIPHGLPKIHQVLTYRTCRAVQSSTGLTQRVGKTLCSTSRGFEDASDTPPQPSTHPAAPQSPGNIQSAVSTEPRPPKWRAAESPEQAPAWTLNLLAAL